MYTIIFRSPLLRALVLAAALTVVAILGFIIGSTHEGHDAVLPEQGTRNYEDTILGISFDYSSSGEVVDQVQEYGECPQELRTPTDACDHRYIGLQVAGKPPVWFLSAESALFAQHPLPREPFREDTLRTWDIDTYCQQGLYPLSCEKTVNGYGLTVVRVGYLPACNGFEGCGDEIFFVTFVETKNPSYPVVAIWNDQSQENAIPSAVINQIVGSVRSLRVD